VNNQIEITGIKSDQIFTNYEIIKWLNEQMTTNSSSALFFFDDWGDYFAASLL